MKVRHQAMRGCTHAMSPPLTFRSITARPVVLKLKRPVVARIATITDWPLILIDLLTEEGIIGRSYLGAIRREVHALPRSGA